MKRRTPFAPEFSDTIELKRSSHLEWVESTAPFVHQHGSVQFLGTTIGKKKITVLFFLVIATLSLFLARSAYLQIFSGKGFAVLAERNKVKTVTVSARRGILYDRNGTVLVQNIPRFVLLVNPAELPRAKKAREDDISQLAKITGLDSDEIAKKISLHTIADPLVLLDEIEYPDALNIITKTATIPGVEMVLRDRRNYLFGDTLSLAHVVGHMGQMSNDEYQKAQGAYLPSDMVGKNGIEAYYEKILRGTDGKKEIEVDALGAQKRIVSEDQPQDGSSIILSLDKELQDITEISLKNVLEKFKTRRGVVIASDPRTGEILALVSLPSYDNNLFSKKISAADYKKLFDDPDNPLYNRAIQGEYPSGSTIKPVVAAAALQEHIVTPATSFLSSGGIHVLQWFFPDWKAGGHGRTNLSKALAESVNTYFYIIAGGYNGFAGMGAEKLLSYYRRFGIDKKTGIDLPGEHAGFVPSKQWKKEKTGEPWYIGDTYHIAIGQGDILVTPMHIHLMTEYFANNGHSFIPHLFYSLKGDEKVAQPAIYQKDLINPQYVADVREGLRQTVLAGSGRRLLSLPITAAGKTGTAQWKSTARPHAWFTGWAPYDNPAIVVTVLVEEGEEGSRSAIAVADDVLRWYATHRIQKPQSDSSNNESQKGKTDPKVDKTP